MKKYIASIGASLLPIIAFAQGYVVTDADSFTALVNGLIGIFFPILLAISVIVVIFGIFRFILNAGDEEARKTGRGFILWGVIGIFLMLSVWGLVRILVNTFTLTTTPVSAPPL